MYIFFGIFILICIFLRSFSLAQKTDYPKIRNMSPCAQKKLLDELMQPFGFLSCPQQNIITSDIDSWQRTFGYTRLLTTLHHILKWYLTANRFILTMITKHG